MKVVYMYGFKEGGNKMVVTQAGIDDAIFERLLIVNGSDCEVNIDDWDEETTIDEIIDYMCLKYDLVDYRCFK